MLSIHKRIEKLLKFLTAGLYEKDKTARLALLSVIAGEHIFLLGPPGTAKSMICRRLSRVFCGGGRKMKYFEYLLNEFSTPDELFGPVSLQELEKGEYRRATEGFLPDADIAFLDEIWKAGPAVLNSLLSIINERTFHNGKRVDLAPLKGLIAASNELPEENAGLLALWDRFTVRLKTKPIEDDENFFKMITASGDESGVELDAAAEKYLITHEELAAWQTAIDRIAVPFSVLAVIKAVRAELTKRNADEPPAGGEKYYVSDRRWKKIVRLIKTSAFLNGRKTADIADAALIADCIWSTEAQRKQTALIVRACIQEAGLEAAASLREIRAEITRFNQKVSDVWYEKRVIAGQRAEPIVVRRQGTAEKYYKVRDKNGRLWYFDALIFTRNYNGYWYRFFDEKWKTEQETNEVVLSDDGKTIFSNAGEFAVEWTPEIKEKTVLERKSALFSSPLEWQTAKDDFDTNDFEPLAAHIQSEKEKLAAYKKRSVPVFKANLFAPRDTAELIAQKIDIIIEEFDDAKVELNRARYRYAKR
ncbi:MAG: AAA family ATPase [Treponema sp.]